MRPLLSCVILYSVSMGIHSKNMKSRSILEGANISMGHNNLLKISTFTLNMARENNGNLGEVRE